MPQTAIDNRIEGFVEVAVTIATDGKLKDVKVTNAQPQGIFEESALIAVNQWAYDAVTQYGKPIEARALLRVNFQLPQHEPGARR